MTMRDRRCDHFRATLLLAAVGGAVAYAQPVAAHGANDTFLLWQFNPFIWLGTIVAGGVYIYATGIIEMRDSTAVTMRQTWFFLGGLALAFFTLQGPLDTFSDDALWVHMIQHLVLVTLVPLLLLIGTPPALLEPLLRLPGVRPVLRLLTNAGFAWLVFTGVFLLWHIPGLYNASVLNEPIHAAQHLSFLGTAILFWWPVFGPVLRELPRLTRANQILYLAVSCQPNVVLGAVFVFASQPFYGVYAGANQLLPRVSPLVDQQLAGSIMWVPGNLLYLVIISKLFLDWFSERDKADRAAATLEWESPRAKETEARSASVSQN